MDSVTITVPGKPAPFVRATGKQYRYQGNAAIKRYMDFKTSVADYAGVVVREPMLGPVAIVVTCYLEKPASRRWDVSNVLKACEDGLNGVAYADDKQIREATIRIAPAPANAEARLLYSCRDWTVVMVTELQTW